MLLLDITIVNVALPRIAQDFRSNLSGLQWVIDAYTLALASLLLTAGILADRSGRKLLFLIGMGVFTLGSILCGTAPNVTFLTLSRAFQGLGGAIMFATSIAMLSASFQGRDRGLAFGIYGGITGLAIAIGPVIGGALVTGLGWRWIFYVNVPIGVIVFVATLFKVAESKDPKAHRLDLQGFITFSVGLGAIIFGLIRSNSSGWTSASVMASLIGGVVMLALFVVLEVLQSDPMFDFRLLRVPTFDGAALAAFGISASIFSMMTYMGLFLQDLLGMSALQAGLRFLPLSLSIFFSAAIAGRLTSIVPKKLLIGPGFVFIGVGMLIMRGLTPDSGWLHLLPGMIVGGIGSGLVNVPLISAAVGVAHPSKAGMASGINSTFRQIGIAGGVAVLGAIFITQIRSTVAAKLAGTVLAGRSRDIAMAAASGRSGMAINALPASVRQPVVAATKMGFVAGLNLILLVAGLLALLCAVVTFVLVREKDFVAGQGGGSAS